MAYVQHMESGSVMSVTDPNLWTKPHGNYVQISAKQGAALHRAQAIESLLKLLAPGAAVYTVLRHVSASGMSRRIDMYTIRDGELRYLSGYAAVALGAKLHRDRGIVVSGCGQDMGFHLVYSLGAALWPNGTPEPHGTRNGEPDTAGGYALKHRWI